MCSDRPQALMTHRPGSLQSSRLPHSHPPPRPPPPPPPSRPNRRALQSLANNHSWSRVKRIHPFVLYEAVNTAWKMKSGTQAHTCAQPAPSPLSHSIHKAHEIHFFFFFQLSVREDVEKQYPPWLQWFSFSVPPEIHPSSAVVLGSRYLNWRRKKKRRCCLMTLTFGLFIQILVVFIMQVWTLGALIPPKRGEVLEDVCATIWDRCGLLSVACWNW